jgi:N-acetylated-alpha-linked acidic dipeptidase
MQALIMSSLGQCELDAQNTPAYTLGRPAVAEMAAKAAQISLVERDFLAVPTAASARANLMHITSRPHVAGTPGDYAMAQFMLNQIKALANPNSSPNPNPDLNPDLNQAAGIDDVHIDPQKVLLNYPVDRSLELVDEAGRVILKPPLAEAGLTL